MPAALPPLSASTLPHYADHVAVPTYDRSALVPAVVHIGVGGFHRAHQALYFDDLATSGETGWGVVGVGLHRPQMGEVLSAQDGLFTVVERDADGDRARVVGAIVDYLFARDQPGAVLARLSDPRTRLVTLTITGNGYLVDEEGHFDVHHADVQHDLSAPQALRTVVGLLTEALARRRASGAGPFTVLSCDNLPDSGACARTAVLSFARLRDPALADWVESCVTFPSSMVDRITPETSPALRDELERLTGVADRWPVVAEPFRQWVVEDDFCSAGRPPLHGVGVQFVRDVAPYKLVKARLLNGGHCALGYLGTLAGHRTSDQAMADPVIGPFLERLLREEVLPLLPGTPGFDLDDYATTTLQRFGNPAVGDALSRLCRRGSTKMPSYLLPSLHDALAAGRPHAHLVVAVAAWLVYLRGTDLSGEPIVVEDAQGESLQALARQGRDDPRPVLSVRSVFGRLVDRPDVVAEIRSAMRAISTSGLAAALPLAPLQVAA